MIVVGTFEDVRRDARGVVGLVPTMGFLHEGHLSLIEAAQRRSDTVVVSVFVNPLQFGEPADLDAYPRNLARDRDLAVSAGADIVFAPDLGYMYPAAPRTAVTVGAVAAGMEGEHRPGHFEGVATVVAKLLAGTQPDTAFFGKKDAQQLAVVRTMVGDLSFPTEIVGMPVVREEDGLALSSRNVRLLPEDRNRACALSRGLFAAADRFEAGERSAAELIAFVGKSMLNDGVEPDYVALASTGDARPLTDAIEEGFLAVAARVGEVRLIDNVTLDPTSGIADRGVRLTAPSILYEEG